MVGTPQDIADRILEFREGGDLLLLQFSPQAEDMERFAEEVIPLVRRREAGTRGGSWGEPERAAGRVGKGEEGPSPSSP